MFYATDIGVLFRDTGAAWAQVGIGDPVASTVAVVAANNTTAETQLLGWTVPANVMAVGFMVRIEASGSVDNAATSTTLTFRLKAAGFVHGGGFAITTQAAAKSGLAWSLRGMWALRLTTGVMYGHGTLTHEITATPAVTDKGSASGTVVLPAQANVLELTAQWTAANVSNVARINQGVIQVVRVP